METLMGKWAADCIYKSYRDVYFSVYKSMLLCWLLDSSSMNISVFSIMLRFIETGVIGLYTYIWNYSTKISNQNQGIYKKSFIPGIKNIKSSHDRCTSNFSSLHIIIMMILVMNLTFVIDVKHAE